MFEGLQHRSSRSSMVCIPSRFGRVSRARQWTHRMPDSFEWVDLKLCAFGGACRALHPALSFVGAR